MPDGPTFDTMAGATQDAHYSELETRLVGEYGGERREQVHHLLEQERDRFAEARVHAFVPILVERSVRSQLNDG